MDILSQDELDRIKIFKDTYNALYIKDFSDEKLNYVKSTSNPIQNRLIDNLNSNHSYDQEFIEGPIGIRKFKLEINGKPKKSVYLFGEYHKNTDGECEPNPSIEFQEYIYRLSRETPSFVDVYIEIPIVKSEIKGKIQSIIIFQKAVMLMFRKNINFIKAFNRYKNPKDTPTTSGYMFKKLQRKLKECIQPANRQNNPNCELMRLHYVDIRSTWDIKDDASMYTEDIGLVLLRNIFRTGVKLNKNSKEILDVIKRVNVHNNVILSMLKILIKGNKINLLDVFYTNKSLKKELNSSYKKEEIISFLKIMSYKKIGNVSLFISKIKSLISSIENDTDLDLNFIKKSEDLFLKLNSLLLDCYCLSRIFKVHNLKKNKNKADFQPEESKNIIIYAGNAHIRNMVEFLNFNGFKSTYSYYEPNEKSCVNMKKPNTYLPKKSPAIFKPPKQSPLKPQSRSPHKVQSQKQSHPKPQMNNPLYLNKLTVVQLQKFAKQIGSKGYSKLKKSDLINLIIKTKNIKKSPSKAQVKTPKQSPIKAQVKTPKQSPVKPQLQPPIKPQMNNPLYLNKLTVVQLRNFAKKIGSKGYSKLNKTHLIEFIISMQE
jgi:Holliday junction resolvase